MIFKYSNRIFNVIKYTLIKQSVLKLFFIPPSICLQVFAVHLFCICHDICSYRDINVHDIWHNVMCILSATSSFLGISVYIVIYVHIKLGDIEFFYIVATLQSTHRDSLCFYSTIWSIVTMLNSKILWEAANKMIN